MPGIVAQIVDNSGKRVWDGRLESAGRLSAILTSYILCRLPQLMARFAAVSGVILSAPSLKKLFVVMFLLLLRRLTTDLLTMTKKMARFYKRSWQDPNDARTRCRSFRGQLPVGA